MPNTMIRVVAVILCLALLVAWSPMRAEAVMAETILLFGDDIIIAIVGCLIGLGIVATPTWYENTARDIYSDVQEEYASNPDNVIFHNFTQGPDPSDPLGLAVMQSVAMGSLLLAAEVAEWIRSWLFDNNVVHDEIVYSDVGFIRDTQENELANAYWSKIDLYSLFNSGETGSILTLYDSSSTYFSLEVGSGGLIKVCRMIALDPYSADTVPMGSFASWNITSIGNSNSFHRSTAITLVNSYEGARSLWESQGGSVYYLTSNTRLFFGSSTVRRGTHYFSNIGCIDSSGVTSIIEEFDLSYTSSTSPLRMMYGLYAKSSLGEVVSSSDDVELGHVAGKDEDLATGYPSWSQGAVENNGTTYYPIGSAPSVDSMASMNQEQIWSGASVPKAPVIDSSGYKAEITYSLGATVDPLLAMASSPDGGYLIYQWYNGSIPIEGQVAPRFYPPVTEVGSATYSCQVGNFKEGLEIGSYTWTQPVKITVTEAPAAGDDEDSGLVVLPDGWYSPILEFFEGLNAGEKNEALQGGQAGIDGVIDVVPDFSGEFVGALTDFSGVLGYEGTAAVLVVPPLTIPAVQNLVPEYQLIGEQRVDLEKYVAMVPEGLLLLIRSLLTLALIAYCPKEFYDTIEYIITLKGGKD